LDTLIYNETRAPEIAVEFKYHRAISSGGTVPRTMHAGSVFADLGRLLLWPDPITRYFVCVTGKDLYGFFTNPNSFGTFGRSPLAPIFTALHPGGSPHTVDAASFISLPDTFRKTMGEWPGPATIHAVVRERLPQEHYVWVFKVEHKVNS